MQAVGGWPGPPGESIGSCGARIHLGPERGCRRFSSPGDRLGALPGLPVRGRASRRHLVRGAGQEARHPFPELGVPLPPSRCQDSRSFVHWPYGISPLSRKPRALVRSRAAPNVPPSPLPPRPRAREATARLRVAAERAREFCQASGEAHRETAALRRPTQQLFLHGLHALGVPCSPLT